MNARLNLVSIIVATMILLHCSSQKTDEPGEPVSNKAQFVHALSRQFSDPLLSADSLYKRFTEKIPEAQNLNATYDLFEVFVNTIADLKLKPPSSWISDALTHRNDALWSYYYCFWGKMTDSYYSDWFTIKTNRFTGANTLVFDSRGYDKPPRTYHLRLERIVVDFDRMNYTNVSIFENNLDSVKAGFVLPVPAANTGTYRIVLSSEHYLQELFIQPDDLQMLVKADNEKAVIFGSSGDSLLQPPYTILYSRNNKVEAAETDSNGLLVVSDGGIFNDYLPLKVFMRKDDKVITCQSGYFALQKRFNFRSGGGSHLLPSQFQPIGLLNKNKEEHFAYIATNKPLYLPDEDIHVNGIARKISNGKLIIPEFDTIQCESNAEIPVEQLITTIDQFGHFRYTITKKRKIGEPCGVSTYALDPGRHRFGIMSIPAWFYTFNKPSEQSTIQDYNWQNKHQKEKPELNLYLNAEGERFQQGVPFYITIIAQAANNSEWEGSGLFEVLQDSTKVIAQKNISIQHGFHTEEVKLTSAPGWYSFRVSLAQSDRSISKAIRILLKPATEKYPPFVNTRLSTDKQLYRVGDTAEITAHVYERNAKVGYFIEAGNSMVSCSSKMADGFHFDFRLPIDSSFTCNSQFTIAYSAQNVLDVVTVPINVFNHPNLLVTSLTKPFVLRSGKKEHIKITVTDRLGAPAQACFSAALVDPAQYQYAPCPEFLLTAALPCFFPTPTLKWGIHAAFTSIPNFDFLPSYVNNGSSLSLSINPELKYKRTGYIYPTPEFPSFRHAVRQFTEQNVDFPSFKKTTFQNDSVVTNNKGQVNLTIPMPNDTGKYLLVLTGSDGKDHFLCFTDTLEVTKNIDTRFAAIEKEIYSGETVLVKCRIANYTENPAPIKTVLSYDGTGTTSLGSLSRQITLKGNSSSLCEWPLIVGSDSMLKLRVEATSPIGRSIAALSSPVIIKKTIEEPLVVKRKSWLECTNNGLTANKQYTCHPADSHRPVSDSTLPGSFSGYLDKGDTIVAVITLSGEYTGKNIIVKDHLPLGMKLIKPQLRPFTASREKIVDKIIVNDDQIEFHVTKNNGTVLFSYSKVALKPQYQPRPFSLEVCLLKKDY